MKMGGLQVQTELILGADGGGTRCRARRAEPSGGILGEGSGAWLGCEAVRRVLWDAAWPHRGTGVVGCS